MVRHWLLFIPVVNWTDHTVNRCKAAFVMQQYPYNAPVN